MGLGETPLGSAQGDPSTWSESLLDAMASVPSRCLFVIALGILHRAGLRTSYYPPKLKANQTGETDLEAFASKVIAGDEESAGDFISFPGEVLPIINERVAPHLPQTKLLTWYPKESVTRREATVRLGEITKQENLDVVLVGYPTRFDR